MKLAVKCFEYMMSQTDLQLISLKGSSFKTSTVKGILMLEIKGSPRNENSPSQCTLSYDDLRHESQPSPSLPSLGSCKRMLTSFENIFTRPKFRTWLILTNIKVTTTNLMGCTVNTDRQLRQTPPRRAYLVYLIMLHLSSIKSNWDNSWR